MLKNVATLSAVVALAIVPALAQSPAPDASGKTTISMTKSFIDAQTSEQWLASKLIGTQVAGSANEKIGSVNDLVLDRNGAVLAAVVGVGGFLGIGEKNVAISFKSTNLVRSSDGDKMTLQVTKNELEQAPAFKPYVPPRPAAQRPEGIKRTLPSAPTN